MANKFQLLKGTHDVTPAQSPRWRYVERVIAEVCETYGIGELRTPTIEKTELFVRSVGETTDVVQKEMYTFEKGGESITLRPEGTAGAVRAALQQGLLGDALPLKIYYNNCQCFRAEQPQAGRYREFHQFGIEFFGCPLPTADAEVIGVAWDLLQRLGLDELTLEINSIGCPQCRPAYHEALIEYYNAHRDKLCETCLSRLERNPLRVLDCKNESCRALAAQAPRSIDHLCEECAGHFEGLQTRLDAMGIRYRVNPAMVRGLDYYTKTVFELVSDKIGAQGTVCGGGRYDGLVEELGGPHTPALGFGMGLERLILSLEAIGARFPAERGCDLYIGSMGDAENIRALGLASELRREGFVVLCDTVGRSVKAQMRYANKMGAAYACILGPQELEQGKATLKRMSDGESSELALDAGAFAERLYDSIHTAILEQGPQLGG